MRPLLALVALLLAGAASAQTGAPEPITAAEPHQDPAPAIIALEIIRDTEISVLRINPATPFPLYTSSDLAVAYRFAQPGQRLDLVYDTGYGPAMGIDRQSEPAVVFYADLNTLDVSVSGLDLLNTNRILYMTVFESRYRDSIRDRSRTEQSR